MSYCVNCGVELAASEKCCPLCGVEVVNPRQPHLEDSWRPYPKREDPMITRLNHRFIAVILSISLALPATICLAIDRAYTGRLTWSLYVAGSLIMIWCWIVPVFLYRKPGYFKIALPISASLLAFLLMIERLQPDRGWFVPLALPLVLLCTILVSMLAVLGSRRIVRGFAIPAAILACAGLLTIGVELIVNYYETESIKLFWSWFIFLPCLALAALSLAIARRQRVKTEILKRLHL